MSFNKFLLLLFSLSGTTITWANPPDTLVYYLDDKWNVCPKVESSYMRKVYKTDTLCQVWDYYLNGGLQMHGVYLDEKLEIAHGKYVWYNKDGKIQKIGHYKNGEWHGKWVHYHTNGQVSSMELYENDSLVNAQLWDADGSISKNRAIYVYAEFPGGAIGYHNFLKENLKYPSDELGNPLAGKIECEMTISETGEVLDIEVVKNYNYFVEQTLKELIPKMPRCQPALFHNIPSKSVVNLEFNFQ